MEIILYWCDGCNLMTNKEYISCPNCEGMLEAVGFITIRGDRNGD